MPRPIGPHVGADQFASRADHPRAKRADHGLVGQPIGVEGCAVMAPCGGAVDQQVAAAVAPDVAEGNGLGRFSAAAGHLQLFAQTASGREAGVSRSGPVI